MDRMIYTALNALSNMRDTKTIQAQNLANQNVPGFRRDLINEGQSWFLDEFNHVKARAFQLEQGPGGFSQEAGFLNQTDQPMDVAIADKGYFFIRPANGEMALSRRGDLRQDANGVLRDGAGNEILDVAMNPIQIPPHQDININELGQISYVPAEGPAGQLVPLTTIATVVPPETMVLRKSTDSHIRPVDAAMPVPDQGARVLQGVLEGSNVNTVEELISSIDLQRQFELGIKMITATKEIDESSARLLRMPEG